jgi:hypothetical protein
MSTLKSKFISAPVNGSTVEPLILQTNNLDRVSIDGNGVLNISNGQVYKDANGNVGFGTNAPGQRVTISNSTQSNQLGLTGSQQNAMQFLNAAGGAGFIVGRSLTVNNANDFFIFDAVANANRLGIDASGNLQFNSGYGSAATAFGCRAWVNFNGSGTVAIRASGNVSSITDNGTGNYAVNFTTAMPDANYSVASNSNASAGSATFLQGQTKSHSWATSSVGINCYANTSTLADNPYVFAAIFR